jgi:hypothetical protein
LETQEAGRCKRFKLESQLRTKGFFFESELIGETKRDGLHLGLKAKEKIKRAPKDSKNLKAFLSVVEKEIIDCVNDKGNSYET